MSTEMEKLHAHIQRTAILCKHNKDSWKQRVTALQELEEMFQSITFATNQLETLAHDSKILIPALIKQLTDARSAVVKTACGTVSIMGQILGLHFHDMATALLPTLLSLSYVTIRIISLSGTECIEKLIAHCRFDVTTLMNGMKVKHESLRVCAIRSLNLILETWNKEELEPLLPSLLDLVQIGINDANATVRSTGRKTLLTLSKLWPAQIEAIAALTDRSVRSAIMKEYPKTELVAFLHRQFGPITPRTTIKKKKFASATKASPDVTIYESKIQAPATISPVLRSRPSEEKTDRKAQLIQWKKDHSPVITNNILRQRHEFMQSPTMKSADVTEDIPEFICTEANAKAAKEYIEKETKAFTMLQNNENESSVANFCTPISNKTPKAMRTDEGIRQLYDPLKRLTLEEVENTSPVRPMKLDSVTEDVEEIDLVVVHPDQSTKPTQKWIWYILVSICILTAACLYVEMDSLVAVVPTDSVSEELSKYRRRQYGAIHLHVDQIIHQATYESRKLVQTAKLEVETIFQTQLTQLLQVAKEQANKEADIILQRAEMERQRILRDAKSVAANLIKAANTTNGTQEAEPEFKFNSTVEEPTIEVEDTVTAQEVQDALPEEITVPSVDSSVYFWCFTAFIAVTVSSMIFYAQLRSRQVPEQGGWTVISAPAPEATQRRIREIKARRLALQRPPPIKTNHMPSDYGSYMNKENIVMEGKRVTTPVRRSRRISHSPIES